jgi:hypothetical protein
VITNPTNSFTNVPTNLFPQILMDGPVQGSSLAGVTLKIGANAVNITTSLSNGNRTITVTPPNLLVPNTVYTLTIAGVKDVVGNIMAAPVVITFTTGAGIDIVSTTVSTVSPAANATGVSVNTTGVITFNERVNPLTVTTSNFYIYVNNTGVAVPGTITVAADRLSATFTPTAPLTAATVYRLYMNSVTDIAGNALTSTNTVFTTQ